MQNDSKWWSIPTSGVLRFWNGCEDLGACPNQLILGYLVLKFLGKSPRLVPEEPRILNTQSTWMDPNPCLKRWHRLFIFIHFHYEIGNTRIYGWQTHKPTYMYWNYGHSRQIERLFWTAYRAALSCFANYSYFGNSGSQIQWASW